MSKLDDQIKRLAAWLDEDGDDCEFRSVELHRPAYAADGEPLKKPEWAVQLRDDYLHSTASADSTDLPEALHDALDRMNAKP